MIPQFNSDDTSVRRRFLKPKEMAARLGVSPKTLHRWSAAGLIDRFPLNSATILFDEAQVMASIERRRVRGR